MPQAANLHLNTFIFPLILLYVTPRLLSVFPHHNIRLLNSILTPVINKRLVIPLSINIASSLLWLSEALQFFSPLDVWFTPFSTVYASLFSSHSFLLSTKSVQCRLLSFLIWDALPFDFSSPREQNITRLFSVKWEGILKISFIKVSVLRIAHAYIIAL